jgi:hypothetical protein
LERESAGSPKIRKYNEGVKSYMLPATKTLFFFGQVFVHLFPFRISALPSPFMEKGLGMRSFLINLLKISSG